MNSSGCCTSIPNDPMMSEGKSAANWNQILIAGHECIDSVLVHQHAGAFHLVACEVRTLLEQIGNLLFMNDRRLLRTKQPNEGHVHEQVPQLRRIEHVGVAEGGERDHSS